MELLHHHHDPRMHALMFPYPVQGHNNPMMQIAHKLLSSGFIVTFVNTDFNHRQMFDKGGASQHLLHIPGLRFEHLSDGLPSDSNAISGIQKAAAIFALEERFTKFVEKMMREPAWPPLTCIISDSVCSWMQNVADKFGVPRVSLWTTPAHANLVYLSQSDLISAGYIPIKDKQNASRIHMNCVPGVASMALSEYPSFFLAEGISDKHFQLFVIESMKMPNEAAWNLGNNLLELEAEAIEACQRKVKNFLPIGPLLPELVLKGEGWMGAARLSIWTEEDECAAWLAAQKERSVLYISRGSVLTGEHREGMEEIVNGVEESGVPFLWAVREEQRGESLEKLRRKVEEGGGRRGKVVGWVPQMEVLCQKAVGGFLCHCGWNSVLESLSAGVPILAAPGGFAEQKMNAHYVANVWQVGLSLVFAADSSRDSTIAAQIRTLFGASPPIVDLRSRLAAIRRDVLASLSPPSGASISNFQLFVEDMQRRSSYSSSSSVAA